MKKGLASVALLVPVVVACSGSSSGNNASKSPSASAPRPSAQAACTKSTATMASQDNISQGHFAHTCVLVKRGTTVYFTNSDDVTHVLTSSATSPQRINAILARNGGSLAYRFSRVGRYVIDDSASAEVVVVIVES